MAEWLACKMAGKMTRRTTRKLPPTPIPGPWYTPMIINIPVLINLLKTIPKIVLPVCD